ncbi:hypothetical protein FSP39_023251 [Pinctada imbricata]|uniref:Transmembrane protein n=1 Tax=Pinctada imbricata TaxID=66713 RepID=A0AA88Y6L8_PINIB|nr:hypothetical protein FSP39_023251 [Pinctada imbricata]
MKIVKLHMVRHPAWHQYVIFYTASLECTIGGVHWVLVQYAQMDFVLQYLKLIQFLVMCHFYWTLATRALRRERLTKLFLIPLLLVVCVYFTVIATLGIVNVKDSMIECIEPYWLELSGGEFATVQLFAVAGFYITRRLNEISTLDSVRWSQKRDLWCIIIVFEISAFVGFVYDMVLQICKYSMLTCIIIYARFNDTEELYSTIFVIFMVLKLLLPIWVMLFVFQPSLPVVEHDDLIPALSEDGNSLFSNSVDDHQYRQLYHPGDDYHSFRDSSPSPGGATPTRSNSSSIMKRSTSNLEPIREESYQSNPERPRPTANGTSIQKPAGTETTLPKDERETPPSQRGKFYI